MIIIRPDRDDQSYRDLAQQFPAVCWIPDDVPDGGHHGTGTLIAPQWVLTAAHVVDAGTTTAGRTVVSAELPPPTRVQFGDRFYGVRRVVIHPRFDRIRFSGPDLALVELDEAVTEVEPIPIYIGHDEVGQEAHLVGNGYSGNFETGQPTGHPTHPLAAVPTKRGATNVITSATDNSLMTTIEPLASATDLEGSLGSGDSGGPLLIDQRGRTAVAGVASTLFGDSEKHQRIGGQDAYVRVSRYASWIQETTRVDFGLRSKIISKMVFALAALAVVAGWSIWRQWTRLARP